jgi:hypothetical protein
MSPSRLAGVFLSERGDARTSCGEAADRRRTGDAATGRAACRVASAMALADNGDAVIEGAARDGTSHHEDMETVFECYLDTAMSRRWIGSFIR